MNKIFSWTNNPTYGNKWDRMVLTKQGAFIAAWVSVNDEQVFTASIVDRISSSRTPISKTFASLEEAKRYADLELRAQGYNA